MTRPNFVVFCTDQHRADWLGCYGHPVVKTPHIDGLAARGLKMTEFHVASPVCMPNRASLLTGRYPTQHGLRHNGCLLPQRANTFVEVLAASGYATAAIGKSHLQPFTDQAPIREQRAATGPIAEAWKAEPEDYGQEEPGRYDSDGRYHFKTPYYGYGHVDMVTAHGDRCGGHYAQWFRDKAPNWEALHDRANQLPHNYSAPQAYRTPIPEDLYPTAYIRDRAIEWLKGREADEPFFLFVSFPDPHHPFNPPGRYWDMYSPEQFDVPLPYEAHRNPTPPMRWLHEQWQTGGTATTPQTAQMHDAEKIRQAMALTAGMITMVDDAIGAVLGALEDAGLGETVTCFTADHGDYMGDFNLLLKGALPFRSITRVPFIWADPAGPKGESDTLASTLDISASVLHRAGIAPYNGMMGRPIQPVVSGDMPERDDLLVEYNDGGPRLGFAKPARVRSLLTPTHRLTLYGGLDWGELYDRAADPDETTNLWDAPEAATVRADLTERLAHQLTGLMDESPLSQRLA
ncbi:MAG: sulfatase-like hydrolase/transferase [Pseudooceanicola sp.]|nr:sulfatase-like hydrolase/transferase [Pseudooceanicola sp.]